MQQGSRRPQSVHSSPTRPSVRQEFLPFLRLCTRYNSVLVDIDSHLVSQSVIYASVHDLKFFGPGCPMNQL